MRSVTTADLTTCFDYGRGFFDGGHAAVKSAQEFVGPVDLLVYPAAFSYRHGIELYLKHLVFHA